MPPNIIEPNVLTPISYQRRPTEFHVSDGNKEELVRQLAQTRRLLADHFDPITRERLRALVAELEAKIAAAVPGDSDVPE